MNTLSKIVYSPLMEEVDNNEGWSKQTIDYVIKHKSRVQQSIRGIAKNRGKLLPTADVEDIYMDLVQYLYKCDDYNIEKAYSENNLVSLDGYIHSCIKFCVIRKVTQKYKEEKMQTSDNVTDEDGKELSLLDTVADKKDIYENSEATDLREICEQCESERYSLGFDMFTLWFVKLETILHNKTDRYCEVLELLGITKKDLADMEQSGRTNESMMGIAKAITVIGTAEALNVLKDFTYSYRRIEDVVALF